MQPGFMVPVTERRSQSGCALRRQKPARRNRGAFSFAELVVVLLIMGIMAAAATPTFFQSLRYNHLEAAARRVKLDLEHLRYVARLKSRSESMTFTGSMTYTLSSDVQSMDHASGSYTVDLGSPPFEMENVSTDFDGQKSVSFDGYGTANRNGTIVLTLNTHQRTVTLDSSTGQITISGN